MIEINVNSETCGGAADDVGAIGSTEQSIELVFVSQSGCVNSPHTHASSDTNRHSALMRMCRTANDDRMGRESGLISGMSVVGVGERCDSVIENIESSAITRFGAHREMISINSDGENVG